MDKKVIVGIVMGIATAIATEHSLEESEARALVGIWLRRNRDKVMAGALAPFLVTED